MCKVDNTIRVNFVSVCACIQVLVRIHMRMLVHFDDDGDLIVSMYVAGEIPATLGQLTALIELQLGSNKLRGEMPPFCACARLPFQ